MRYRPDWRKIIFLAVLFHVVVISAYALIFSTPTKEIENEEDIQEIEWVESEIEENSAVDEVEQVAENSIPIEFPPIELPPLPEPTIEEKPEPPKPVETPAETKKTSESSSETKTEGEEKTDSDEDSRGKIKVLVKVYPKDIFEQLISVGILKERPILKSGKIVIAITIGLDGRAGNIEIRRGGGMDEMGNMIDIVSEAAASAWIFAPFKDEEGNAKIIKTQIEFKPEDF